MLSYIHARYNIGKGSPYLKVLHLLLRTVGKGSSYVDVIPLELIFGKGSSSLNALSLQGCSPVDCCLPERGPEQLPTVVCSSQLCAG